MIPKVIVGIIVTICVLLLLFRWMTYTPETLPNLIVDATILILAYITMLSVGNDD